MKKIKAISVILIFSLILGAFSLTLIFKEPQELSQWERRRLAQWPELSVESLRNGDFAEDLALFLSDQLPLRDSLRRLKALVHFGLYRQKDNEGIYIADGYAGKLDKEISQSSVEHFTDRITNIHSTYLKESQCKVYYSIIPDKNAFLAPSAGYPHLDYEKLISAVDSSFSFMQKIDIAPLLSKEDFYYTDTHWKQEQITDVAEKICSAMGADTIGETEKKEPGDFYGVYYGQSALPLDADRLSYLTNETIESCSVYNHETKETTAVYNLSKLDAMDRYDIFLSGAVSLMEITNPEGHKDKELVIFRDSFGSSLAPLLIKDYSKITLIDTRYIDPKLLDSFITFSDQDVLFIYSTLLINSSMTLK